MLLVDIQLVVVVLIVKIGCGGCWVAAGKLTMSEVAWLLAHIILLSIIGVMCLDRQSRPRPLFLADTLLELHVQAIIGLLQSLNFV